MQEQISSLTATVRLMAHSESPTVGGTRSSVVGPPTGSYGLLPNQRPLRRVSTAKEASFQGPTTSGFSFDLAKSSLLQRGIVERNDPGDEAEGDLTQEPSPLASPSAPNRDSELRHAVDPLWALPKNEALRLCRVYEEEMGIMYPVLELSELLDQVHRLYGLMDRTLEPDAQTNGNALDREDVYILRLVFACALTAEGSGRSEQAIALFDSVRVVQDNCVWGPPEIKSIIFLTLVVGPTFFSWDSNTLLYDQYAHCMIVHLLLSNGRRDTRMADDWNCRAHVSGERSSPTRITQSARNCGSRQRPSLAAVLVNLYPRHALELWHWHAVRTRGYGH